MTDETNIFAEADARQKLLFEQLAVAPIVEVFGVVAPNGAGGAMSQGDELWTLLFTLDGWRVAAGDFQNKKMQVRRQVSREELDKFQDMITSYLTIHIQARVIVDPVYGHAQAMLENFIGSGVVDADLNQHAEQLQQPVTFADATFGEFVFERGVDWFTTETEWNGKPLSLHLSATEPDEVEAALATARSLWQDQEKWQRRVGDYAIEELLPLKNDSWLDEDEPEVSAEGFKERMTLESITTNSEGSFDFWHDDGDLFWGHSILISGSLTEGLKNADIPG